MPWIAYLSLYYNVFTANRFHQEFGYLSRLKARKINDFMVRIAVKNYRIGRCLILLRKTIGKIKS